MTCNPCSGYEEYLQNYLQNASKLAVLLDYDGTLTPIAAHPDMAKIPQATKNILEKLSKIPEMFLAIISGRGVTNVKEMVGLNDIIYAGNHGLEVLYPDGSTYNHQLPGDFNSEVKQLIKKLEAEVVKDGAWIENKGPSLTFHFRAVPEHLQSEIESKALKIMEAGNFRIGKAHCALEIRPKVDWNKGTVALMLLDKQYENKWKENVKVVFVGDDTTDEDAMKALKGNAATFRIAQNADIVTNAERKIASTADVVKILKIIEKSFKK